LSSDRPFKSSAAAAVHLYESWVETAESALPEGQTPSLLDLQTACRETGCALPELDSYARARAHPRPGFLLCGGDAALASQVAGMFGYESALLDVPDSLSVWRVDRGGTRIFICRGTLEQGVTRQQVPAVIGALQPTDDLILIEESADVESPWRFLWLPHPHRFHAAETTPSEIELLLMQRAAMILDNAPEPLQNLLKDLGQKLWITSPEQLSAEEERVRLLVEIGSLGEERNDDLDVRAGAAWTWLVSRLLEQIAEKKRRYAQLLNQQEIKLSTTRHLLGQYRKNWSGGIRSLVETHVQSRTGSSTFAAFYDAAKPGPETGSFLAALSLPALWTKLDDFAVDRMVDFMAGLTGLAAKLELRQIPFGEANARWAVKSLTTKLEQAVNEKRIFPSGGGKRGGLVGSLTGRSQAVLDERKAQVSKGVRLLMQVIENDFAAWAAALTESVENGIKVQLSGALSDQGFSDIEGVRAGIEGLERLEQLIQGKSQFQQDPETAALEWLRMLASRRWIPLYHPQDKD
jgi:hypothetical protein